MGRIKLTTAQTALLMAILTLVSKLFGFVREIVMANYYGAGMVTDAFVMSQNIPNYIIAAIITAVGTAYMPCFSRKYEIEGPAEGDRFTSNLINLQLIISGSLIIVGEIFAPQLVSFFAPGFSAETASLTVFYLRAAFFVVMLNIFISVFGSYLQYKGIFISPILFGYAQSISVILFTILSVRFGYKIIVFGLLIGYGIRAVSYVFIARSTGFRYTADFSFGLLVREVTMMAIPVFIGGWVNQINAFIDKMLASGLAEGSVSALNYGYLTVTVITSISVAIITTIVYPRFNKAIAVEDYEKVSELSESAINLSALITIPFTIGAMVFAGDVIQVLFERGAFDTSATDATSNAFMFYALTLFFGGICSILTFLYYALKDMRTGVICSAVSVGMNIVLNFILIGPMGVAGLALATGIAQAVNAVLLLSFFERKHPGIKPIRSARKILLILAISIVSVAAARLFYVFIAPAVSIARMIRLGLAVMVAFGVYLLFLYLAHFEELGLLRSLLKRGSGGKED